MPPGRAGRRRHKGSYRWRMHSLVGLSRQIALQRELDVVANNIANLNTTGFKADGAVFQEYLMPAARANRFAATDRQHQLRARPRHLARPEPGPDPSRPATRSTSRSTATASWWCRRRAASATPATARCRSTASGQLVTTEGDQVLGENGPITLQPTDRDISISHGRHHQRCARAPTLSTDSQRGKLRLVALRPAAALLQKDGAEHFHGAGRRRRRRPAPDVARRAGRRSRNRTCAASSR